VKKSKSQVGRREAAICQPRIYDALQKRDQLFKEPKLFDDPVDLGLEVPEDLVPTIRQLIAGKKRFCSR